MALTVTRAVRNLRGSITATYTNTPTDTTQTGDSEPLHNNAFTSTKLIHFRMETPY